MVGKISHESSVQVWHAHFSVDPDQMVTSQPGAQLGICCHCSDHQHQPDGLPMKGQLQGMPGQRPGAPPGPGQYVHVNQDHGTSLPTSHDMLVTYSCMSLWWCILWLCIAFALTCWHATAAPVACAHLTMYKCTALRTLCKSTLDQGWRAGLYHGDANLFGKSSRPQHKHRH